MTKTVSPTSPEKVGQTTPPTLDALKSVVANTNCEN